MPQSLRRWLMLLGVPVLLCAAVGYYYVTTKHLLETDNAYIQQDKVSVSAEAAGRIVEVMVQENQPVKAGQLLFRIDPVPYQLALDEANAAVATALARVDKLQTDFSTSSVDINSAEEAVAFYQKEYQRQQALIKNKVTTDAQLRAAEHSLKEARARLATAQADALKAKAALSTGLPENQTNPEVLAALAQKARAELNLSRTEVRAPVSGVVSQASRLQVGQMSMQGLPALTIVRSDSSWIEANFKETQLNKMRVGQTVAITVDAYDGLALKGRVASIGAGTGSEFSILPAQNANANWVKVTQRIPVRIALDEAPKRPLIAGLSVHVSIDTRQ